MAEERESILDRGWAEKTILTVLVGGLVVFVARPLFPGYADKIERRSRMNRPA